jgi:alkylation response protein AidB-like acyl-CoA dehydrogenase
MLSGRWVWPNLTSKEREIRDLAMDVARREIEPRAAEHDLNGTFVRDSIGVLFDSGLMGANIPEEYGGMGGTDLSAVIAQEAISAACGSTGASYCFHLLTNHLLASGGPDRLRQKYLPQLAKSKLAAFCLNEGGGLMARCLSGQRDVVAALRDYEAYRMPRATQIMTQSWRIGSTVLLQNPIYAAAIRIQKLMSARIIKGYQQTISYDPSRAVPQ